MKFSKLAKYLDQLEKTSSRLKITEILADLFKKADSEEIDKIVYLLLGRLAPNYQAIVFNMAERMVLQVLSNAYKCELNEVRSLYKKKGDLGNVAEELAKARRSPTRPEAEPEAKLKTGSKSVSEVFQKLQKIAMDEGEGSQERKVQEMASLLKKLDPLSVRFVTRIPVGKLRLGFSDKTILDALSWMKKGDKSVKSDLEKAYFVLPDVGLLAKSVKKLGIQKATKTPIPALGIPILPMLAQRLKSPAEMIEKMEEVVVEPKFDGLRIQLHYKASGFEKKDKVKAYTRNMNETSWMFPELGSIDKYIRAKEVILDTEAVGIDEERKKMANFQVTMTRRRKHQIKERVKKVAIKFYVFDILYKDGKSLVEKPYLKRRQVLARTIKNSKLMEVVDYQVTKDPEVIRQLMKQEVKEGLEGIIVKRADSKYVPGRTGWRWVKMKEEESAHAKLADTLDCVVMGYSVGRGKRAQFGVGRFLVGIRDNGKIKTTTKIGTGITDEQFRELKKRLVKLEVKEKPKEYKVHKDLKPDYWVEPKLVVEVAADEITKSPKHTLGYALRFPRLIKFRDDKSASQATSISEVIKLFKLQK